jgi:hypothetical protein
MIGGVAGHYAVHHGWLGAAAGCLIGRHEAKKHKRASKLWRGRWGCLSVETAARALGLAAPILHASNPSEIETAFNKFLRFHTG